MPSENFKCKQCGNCCINLGDAFSTCATTEDIDLWEKEDRNDILELNLAAFLFTRKEMPASLETGLQPSGKSRSKQNTYGIQAPTMNGLEIK
jgi:hypothetical protein